VATTGNKSRRNKSLNILLDRHKSLESRRRRNGARPAKKEEAEHGRMQLEMQAELHWIAQVTGDYIEQAALGQQQQQ
jgi:hypothetical protein